MKSLSIIPVLLFSVVFSKICAQSNFVDGYIIKPNNDSVFGQIDSRNFYKNSLLCSFKMKDGSVIEYLPNQLLGYRINNGKYYISKTVGQKQLFLEYLINGRLSIYSSQDFDGKNHYYAGKDSTLSELKYRQLNDSLNGRPVVKEDYSYVGVLNYYTADYPELKEEISNLKPDHKRLIRFAKKYHDKVCQGEQCEVYEKELSRKVMFYASSGALLYLEQDSSFSDVLKIEGVNVLVQAAQQNERIYLGFGFNYLPQMDDLWSKCRGLLSVHYLNLRKGFSPTGSIEVMFPLDFSGMSYQTLNAGLKYQFGKFALGVNAKYFADLIFFDTYSLVGVECFLSFNLK